MENEWESISKSKTREMIPVHVYCRISPADKSEKKDWLRVQNANILEVNLPQGLLQTRETPRQYEYGFKQVFNDDSQQADVYETVAKPLVKNLLAGRNSVLFTYGITGSGKTYTMTGSGPQPGIMQSCLSDVFADIGNTQMPKYCYKPDGMNGFELFAAVKDRRTDAKQSKSGQQYAVFVSYIEFYNNGIYDLLMEPTEYQKPLRSHIIREDVLRNQMYAHGVTEMEVKSVADALTIFQLGQQRKHMAETLLNAVSSRSHSSFNIRVVRLQLAGQGSTEQPKLLISQLSLVDLAGSDRTSRTHNSGLRLREASQINNSLLTLRTCLEYLRENQQAAAGTQLKKIPYRDAKLTHMFKPYFEGEGQVSMIICIKPHLMDFSETLHVLKFAELTRELQISRHVVQPKKTLVLQQQQQQQQQQPPPPPTEERQRQVGQVTAEIDNVLQQTLYELGPDFSAVHIRDADMALTSYQYKKILSQRVQRRLILRSQLSQKFEFAREQIEQLQFENDTLRNELGKVIDAISRTDQQRVQLTQQLQATEQQKLKLSQTVRQRQLQVKALQEHIKSKEQLLRMELENEAYWHDMIQTKIAYKQRKVDKRLCKQAKTALTSELPKKDYHTVRLVSHILETEVTTISSGHRRSVSANQVPSDARHPNVGQRPMEVDDIMRKSVRRSTQQVHEYSHRRSNSVDASVQTMPTIDDANFNRTSISEITDEDVTLTETHFYRNSRIDTMAKDTIAYTRRSI